MIVRERNMNQHQNVLIIWTVYDHPTDYPDNFVARRSECRPHGVIVNTQDMFIADTLSEVRQLLPRGLIHIGRDPRDDPKIVEVWL